MLYALQEFHSTGFVHLDVKQDNFRISKDHVVKLLDFGLVIDCIRGGKHKPIGKFGFSGTPYFASTKAHEGRVLSRRDDLESLGYSMMALLKEEIPWENKEITEFYKEKQDYLRKDYNDLKGIWRFVKLAAELRFTEEPDYARL